MQGTEPGSRPAPHVLKIAPTPFFGDRGCHVRILEELRALEQRGYRVTVCTYPVGRDLEGVDVRRSLATPWVDSMPIGPSLHKFYLDPLLTWTVLRACLRDRPQIIHGHLHEGALIGAVVAALCRVPLVADLQGSLCGELLQHDFFRENGLLHRSFHALERWILGLPGALLVSSSRVLDGFESLSHSPRRPVRVIHDGVDVESFTPARPDEDLRGKLSLPTDRKIVGYLGVLNDYQGISVLLEAARLVLQEMPGVRFQLMGYPDVERYREEAARLGLTDDVIFTGRIPYDQARDYLAACDVGVSAKRAVTEANGKLLNYMAVGIPVVATDTPINRDLLGDLGIYAEIDDPPSLAQALLRVLRDEELARELGDGLRRRAVEEVSWQVGGERIVEVYEQLLSSDTPP